MSKAKIDELLSLLNAAGFTEGEDYELAGDGSNSVVVSVSIDLGTEELPEVLRPFGIAIHEVERSMWKGNCTKQTWNGANFELALREYASSLMHKDPEAIALESTLNSIVDSRDLEAFKAYQLKRKAIWERIVSAPEIVALEKDLEENYF